MNRFIKIILLVMVSLLMLVAIGPGLLFTLFYVPSAITSAITSSWHEHQADSNDSGSGASSISADGRYIAFSSNDARLPGGEDDKQNAYIYDNETGEIILVSTNPQGAAANGGIVSVGPLSPRISADGSTLVFFSQSSNLVEGAEQGLFAKKLDTGEIKPVLITDPDSPRIYDFIMKFSVSGDGRFVVYDSMNGVFVHDSESNMTTRADVDYFGNEVLDAHPGDGIGAASISADGRYVAFMLTTKITNAFPKNNWRDTQIHIYIKDMQSGHLELASVDSEGKPFDHSIRPSLSADGKILVFEYENIENYEYVHTIQLRDVNSGKTVQVDEGARPAISPNGRYIAYEHDESKNSGKADCKTNKNCPNLFVFDRQMGASVREIIPSDWNNWSRMESLAMSDNGILVFTSSGSFEGVEPERCKVHAQWDMNSQLIDIYCDGVYRKDLSSGQLIRIGSGS